MILLLISTYSLLVFQPHKGIKFLDKAFIYDYSINIKSISSNKNLLKPFYIIEQLQVNDDKNELIIIPSLKIGLNLRFTYKRIHIIKYSRNRSWIKDNRKTYEPFFSKGTD